MGSGRNHNMVANSCFLIKKDFPSSALLSASALRLLNLSYGARRMAHSAYEEHGADATEESKRKIESVIESRGGERKEHFILPSS